MELLFKIKTFNETKNISSCGSKWDGIKKILDLVIYIYDPHFLRKGY
jgi:hypothetical protein